MATTEITGFMVENKITACITLYHCSKQEDTMKQVNIKAGGADTLCSRCGDTLVAHSVI